MSAAFPARWFHAWLFGVIIELDDFYIHGSLLKSDYGLLEIAELSLMNGEFGSDRASLEV